MRHPPPPNPKLEAFLKNAKDPYERDLDNPADWDDVLDDYGDLFDALRRLHKLSPDIRFGQLICNLAFFAGTGEGGAPYTVPDQRLLRSALEMIERRERTLDANDDAASADVAEELEPSPAS